MLKYTYNSNIISIKETSEGSDVVFSIKILDDRYLEQFRLVMDFFNMNKTYTDVLFYPYEERGYKVIVRNDYYNDFLAELLKSRLLQSLRWNDLVL
jgi:hypothetical protein